MAVEIAAFDLHIQELRGKIRSLDFELTSCATAADSTVVSRPALHFIIVVD
jgi:hypothetical protein